MGLPRLKTVAVLKKEFRVKRRGKRERHTHTHTHTKVMRKQGVKVYI